MDVLGKSDSESPDFARSGDNNTTEKSLEDDTAQAGFEAAAADVYSALKASDESGFRDALQAAIEMSR
jgi:hypothetical protein